MRLDVSQQMRMDQRMVLAPRMIQSMEILQLPLLALQERIEQEMLSNPVLEMEEPSEEGEAPASDESASNTSEAAAEPAEGEQTLLIKEDNNKTEDFARLDNMGSDFEDYLERSDYVKARRSSEERDRKLEAMQNTAAPAQSLHEYLLDQWAFVECPPIIQKAGRVIIDNLEDTGYLTVPLASLIEHVREPVTNEQMEEALRLVQGLEPSGVGARDLAECMLIQLRASGEDRSLEIELISHHLKDIEMNRFPAIAKKTGRSIGEIKNALANVARLYPRPGLQIGSHAAPYVIPDVIVDYDESTDSYIARLADGSTPRLRINTGYQSMIKQGGLTSDAKEFLQNSVRSARWLIESIEQRKATLLRVVNHVIKNQREFLEHGQLSLKPLPMVDVANALGIHVGTVSRAVSGKYMQTPIGIFPLRYFFCGGTETAEGESMSWDAVKGKLQEIINREDKNNPYNDDELVEQLTKEGLTLARRTVAKYRALLNIPPARRRRQFE
jgi:RNA polymerase sigma-54 factor